ncbi:MAG: DUF4157 domain-containing protein [Lunatimonas sp.]|uniref:eCIS core domain-containing protein n=1 Tax=Lunatimonas sp. TaxID=2060141 RepID=UPI00263B6BB5|nr:DUF4157 domain-containing protein [Lunatimonas sp.]MCC5938907.1 DUF4157 domain-containing protein [Lunatimonas sp.]
MEKANPQSKPKGHSYFRKGGSADFFLPQAKMEVNQPDDTFEQEADAAADQVVARKPGDASFFTGNSLMRSEEKEEPVQAKAEEDTVHKMGEEYEEEASVQAALEEDVTDSDVQQQPLEAEDVVQPKEEEIAQKSTDEEAQRQEEEEVQARGSSGGRLHPAVEHGISSSKGMGSPLGTSERKHMESGFGADFSGVNIHTDSHAVQLSRELGAQAFTHGNDIFFNEGKYNPGSKDGQHLLAHELTHTLQQGASKPNVQRQASNPAPAVSVDDIPASPHGKISEEGGSYKMELNNFKVKRNLSAMWDGPDYKLPKSGERSTRQISVWNRSVREDVRQIIESKITGLSAPDNKYTLVLKNNPTVTFGGTLTQLVNEVLIPKWDNGGNATTYQVEHIVDWQVAGGDKNVDDIRNLILLEGGVNNDLGQRVRTLKNQHIERVLNHYRNAGVTQDPNQAVQNYNIYVKSVSPEIDVAGSTIVQSQITNPTAVQNPLKEALIDIRNFEVPEGHFFLKTSQRGGGYVVPYSANGYQSGSFRITVDGDAAAHQINSITMIPLVDEENVEVSESHPYDVEQQETDVFLVSGLRNRLRNFFELKKMSPVELDEESIDIVGGMNLYAIGKVHPSIPLISEADIDVVFEGQQVRLRKLFDFGELDVPAPFEINSSSLEVFLGSSGFGVAGNIDFGIQRVGEGSIGASASTSGVFELAGKFNFDSQLFDPAEINVEYKDNVWTIGGTIGIPAGKVNGVKSATITATYSENTFSAEGEAELDIPGIEKGSMSVTYGEDGFSIGGNFAISGDVPGIRGGNVEARVSKSNEEEGYSVFVSGTAQPDIPGINSTLSVTYENGALTIMGNAAYSRGMLSGSLEVGATNRTIGEDGQPSGDPDDTIRVFGGGTLTLQLTPWLAATAGVKFLPNGEMEVTARLATDTYDVFPRKEYTKNLFRAPTIEIPLFAIPLGPRSLGLVAQISGGLDFKAGFGPGQLRNLSAEITYNPDHEEETSVRGSGSFVIPADAGLTLRGDLGLGVSVAIASLSGGIEIAGTLGLEGEAAAGVEINWTPQEGLILDARGSIIVNPKFTFDINAFARASLGIGWFSISETWRHNLASFNWGPDIQFGIVFPIHYEEGEPFDMSLDDIEVIYPDIQVVDTAVGLARSIKNDLFG